MYDILLWSILFTDLDNIDDTIQKSHLVLQDKIRMRNIQCHLYDVMGDHETDNVLYWTHWSCQIFFIDDIYTISGFMFILQVYYNKKYSEIVDIEDKHLPINSSTTVIFN